MQPTSHTWRMANTLAGGNLAETLRKLDAEGLSLRAIAERIKADHQIDVTHMAIRNWLAVLNDDEAAA